VIPPTAASASYSQHGTCGHVFRLASYGPVHAGQLFPCGITLSPDNHLATQDLSPLPSCVPQLAGWSALAQFVANKALGAFIGYQNAHCRDR